MKYRIIFSFTNYFCDGTYDNVCSVLMTVKTDSESINPARVLYDGLSYKEQLLAGKNSIISYDKEGNINTVYSNIRFA